MDDFRLQIRGSQDDYAYNQGFGVLIFNNDFPEFTYDTIGFLEKNRDLLHFDSIQLLSSCKCKLPQIFAPNMCSQPEKPVAGSLNKSGGVDSQKLSAMSKFKELRQQDRTLLSHYCIKRRSLSLDIKWVNVFNSSWNGIMNFKERLVNKDHFIAIKLAISLRKAGIRKTGLWIPIVVICGLHILI
ncbi:hypothetical protein Ccrd_024867 [Cynara cardunculus var. scolymus]|uniref:Uncharacterized protein n=1 Tax=Cynara cardunculus var. scolymus TaxID=59895 RepID=A0A124SAL2_CYNCS|nr:hypothetical protein Ccrd_024867 [Cynara cardunculus var. scolymus]